MAKFDQRSSKLDEISKTFTEVPHFDVLLAVYINFSVMKTICDRKNTIRGNEYKKMRKIVGGNQKALKSA